MASDDVLGPGDDLELFEAPEETTAANVVMIISGEDNPMAQRERGPQPPRSPKAGRPPREPVVPARVRRRQKTAHVAMRKDTMLSEASQGPRVLWGRTKPKVKKG